MRILKFAAAIAAGVVALGVAAYAYFIYSPDPTPPHLSGQVQTATIQVGSRLRSYVEYIPAQLPAGAPLVIALHGTTMDGALMRKFTGYEFDSMADTHGFAVFYPDGYKTNWNDCLKAGAVAATLEHVDDVGFILALIGKAQSEFKIESKESLSCGLFQWRPVGDDIGNPIARSCCQYSNFRRGSSHARQHHLFARQPHATNYDCGRHR